MPQYHLLAQNTNYSVIRILKQKVLVIVQVTIPLEATKYF